MNTFFFFLNNYVHTVVIFFFPFMFLQNYLRHFESGSTYLKRVVITRA